MVGSGGDGEEGREGGKEKERGKGGGRGEQRRERYKDGLLGQQTWVQMPATPLPSSVTLGKSLAPFCASGSTSVKWLNSIASCLDEEEGGLSHSRPSIKKVFLQGRGSCSPLLIYPANFSSHRGFRQWALQPARANALPCGNET